MRVVIIGLIFAAIILAGGTAYLLRDYLSAQQAEFAAQVPTAPTLKVLVAAADMPVGTPVNDKNAHWVDWPEDGIQEEYLLESKDAKILETITKDKYISRRALGKGEPITMVRLYKSAGPGFLRGALGPGMRAVAIRSSAESAAAGFILPGDRVDVMLTHSMLSTAIQREGQAAAAKFKAGIQHTSETIIENVRVLAIDQNVNEFQEGAQVGKTILLEVSPKNAEKLYTAKAMGQLSLTLRSARTSSDTDEKQRVKFTTDVEVSPMLSNFDQLINGRKKATASAPRQTSAPRPSPTRYRAPAPAQKKQLSIYRGVTGTTGNTAP